MYVFSIKACLGAGHRGCNGLLVKVVTIDNNDYTFGERWAVCHQGFLSPTIERCMWRNRNSWTWGLRLNFQYTKKPKKVVKLLKIELSSWSEFRQYTSTKQFIQSLLCVFVLGLFQMELFCNVHGFTRFKFVFSIIWIFVFLDTDKKFTIMPCSRCHLRMGLVSRSAAVIFDALGL